MYILGLGGSLHDFSACLLKDSQILSMIEDERITRDKHGINLGVRLAKGYSRKYCLEYNNIQLSDLSLIVANDIINKSILFRLNDVKFINHHLSHASSAFFTSPFEESAILVIDSVGSKLLTDEDNIYETISYYYGKDNEIELVEKKTGKNIPGSDFVENSMGIFYSLITELIGFSELQEGKTMGLAPYGTDHEYKKIKNYIDYSNGEFRLSENAIAELIEIKKEVLNIKDQNQKFAKMADYAWAAQKILEDVILDCCKHIKFLTGCNNICLAGGTFLNSVANYKVYKSKLFRSVFLQPAAGDNGTSIGAALYGYHSIMQNKRTCLINQ